LFCTEKQESDGDKMKAYFVNKRLAFGSGITSWRHVEQLQALGITHVINLRFNCHGKKERSFKVLWMPFKDDKQTRPRWFYRKAWNFYFRAMEKPHSKVFVMCRVGICRSASLTYFLLRCSGMSETLAQNAIHRARQAASICKAYRESGESWLRNGSPRAIALKFSDRATLSLPSQARGNWANKLVSRTVLHARRAHRCAKVLKLTADVTRSAHRPQSDKKYEHHHASEK
jgi:hypothetical protein